VGRFRVHKPIIRAALLVVGVGLIAYAVGAGIAASRFPAEFTAVRRDAAMVSQEITNLTELTGRKLADANAADLAGDAARTVALIEEARGANRDAHAKAFELTEHLRKLAESLGGVASADKQREGSSAIALALALVSEFVEYTGGVETFLNALERTTRFRGETDRSAAAAALRAVNERVAAINTLNASFRAAMGTFDAPEE